jgi:hypothetical protein
MLSGGLKAMTFQLSFLALHISIDNTSSQALIDLGRRNHDSLPPLFATAVSRRIPNPRPPGPVRP